MGLPGKRPLGQLTIANQGTAMAKNPNGTFASSRLRIFLGSFLIMGAGIAVVGAIGSSRSIIRRIEPDALYAAKIAPWVIEHTANGQQAEFFIVLADQANLSQASTLQTKA